MTQDIFTHYTAFSHTGTGKNSAGTHYVVCFADRSLSIKISPAVRQGIFWSERRDSNQRPLESELSGRQVSNRCATRVWWVLHKFTVIYEKSPEALQRKAYRLFRSSSQIVV